MSLFADEIVLRETRSRFTALSRATRLAIITSTSGVASGGVS
jgi:hypothetical protein